MWTPTYSQVFTQIYYDRCTGEIKTVTANFLNNTTATVAFYSRVKTFTIYEVMDGTLLKWMDDTYNWWYSMSPCSITSQQTQIVQSNILNINNIITNTPTTNLNTESNSINVEQSTSENSNNDSSDNSDENNEKEKDDDDSEKKDNKLMPVIVSGDIMTMQNPNKTFNNVISTGITKSSIYGDVSYNGNLLIWDNLNQISIGTSYTKSNYNNKNIDFIENYSVSYLYSFGVNSLTIGYNKIIPKKNIGMFGYSINKSFIFGKNINNYILNINYNILYTNTFKINTHFIYSPAIIISSSPITYIDNLKYNYISKDITSVLSNSFDYKITKKFKININYTIIVNSNKYFPILNNFIIGSKINL